MIDSEVKADIDEDDDEIEDKVRMYLHTTTTNEYDVYLGDSVGESKKYYDLFYKLSKAGKTDKFNIHLNNRGGLVSSGVNLINAIRTSAASTTIHVEGPVYSMGAILALCGDSIVLYPNTFLMFHDYSTSEYGKGNEIHISVTNYQQYFSDLLYDVCYPFLSKKEIKSIQEGKDLYVPYESSKDKDGKRIVGAVTRLKRRIK